MVVVRLARGGAKKHPFYHIVVTDSRRPRDSGYIERLGYFNPFATKKELPVLLNRDRFDYWISQGAQSSQRVSSIIAKIDNGEFTVDTPPQTDAQTKKTAMDTEKVSAATQADSETVTKKENNPVENLVAESHAQSNKAKTRASQTTLELDSAAKDEQVTSTSPTSKSEDAK